MYGKIKKLCIDKYLDPCIQSFSFSLIMRKRGLLSMDNTQSRVAVWEEGRSGMNKTVEMKRTGRAYPTLRPSLGDYVAAEQNLETIGFFSARYSRLRSEESSKVVELSDNRRIEIIPATKYGLPNAE